MNPATLEQAQGSATRVEALANRLAVGGSLDAAEICAGAAMAIRVLAVALTPPPPVATPGTEAPSE